MSLDDFKAAEAARKAAKAAEAKAAPKPAAKPEAKEEAKAPEPAPAAKEEAADDWEKEEEQKAPAQAPAPAPQKPKEEPKKEAPAPAPKAEEPEEEEEEEEEVAVKKGAVVNENLKEPDPRPHNNVVFIGHVDAGKSTTCGQILYLCGCVDDRTIEKYQKEAKDKNRESWFLAYIMDTGEEEKAKGKTVEVGRAHFETTNRRYTVLDAPGHKSYVPNMIAGASQADVAVLIISARKGEFETGFERGGQTREHALLAKTLGVEKLIMAVNKMDDPSVGWAESRFTEIHDKMSDFLKKSGFKDDQLFWLPMSGLTGSNVKERVDTPDWFKGSTLLEFLDKFDVPSRSKDGPLRIPMLDGYRDMGAVMAIGKVEQGTARPGQKVMIMPIGVKATILSVFINEEEMQYGGPGENVTMKMGGITEDQLCKGYVICDHTKPVRVVSKFKAILQVIELPDERPVMTPGYKAVMHAHVANEECEILKLYDARDMKNPKKIEQRPGFVREGSVVTCSIVLARSVAVDVFTGVAQLGRFTLRDEGRTIAIGKIIELPKEEVAKKK